MDSAKSKAANAPRGAKATKGPAPKGRDKKSQEPQKPDVENNNKNDGKPEHAREYQEPEEKDEWVEVKEVEKPPPTKRQQRGALRDWNSYNANPPTKAELKTNGRRVGRVLIPWTRPRMMEKLVLHIQYEAERAGLSLPWAHIAHRLSPGSSGASITQHLARVRAKLIAEGHMVPPYPQKPGADFDPPEVRGVIRLYPKSTTDDSTRKVPWTEPLDDATEALGNAQYVLQNKKVDEEDYDDGELNDDGPSDEAAGQLKSSELDQKGAINAARSARSTKRVYNAESHNVFDDLDLDEGFGDPKRTRISDTALGRAVGVQPGFASSLPGLGPMTPQGQSASGYAAAGMLYQGGQNNFQGDGRMGSPAPGMVAPQPSTPPTSNNHPGFTTKESCPDYFDFENATPRHQQMFLAHLAEYNSRGALYKMGFNDEQIDAANKLGMDAEALEAGSPELMGVGDQFDPQMSSSEASVDPNLLAINISSTHSGGGMIPDQLLAPDHASMTSSQVASNDPANTMVGSSKPMSIDEMLNSPMASNDGMLNDPMASNDVMFNDLMMASNDAMLSNTMASNDGMLNNFMMASNDAVLSNTMASNDHAFNTRVPDRSMLNSPMSSNPTMAGNAQGSQGAYVDMRMLDGTHFEIPELQRPADSSSMPETSTDNANKGNERK